MSTTIRPEVSKRNKYWISRHRYYELKHLCLQYKELKTEYNNLLDFEASQPIEKVKSSSLVSKTEKIAILRLSYAKRINAIEASVRETDDFFQNYILRAVTEGLSYQTLKARFDIPCGKDMWYEIYRKFFFILNAKRE